MSLNRRRQRKRHEARRRRMRERRWVPYGKVQLQWVILPGALATVTPEEVKHWQDQIQRAIEAKLYKDAFVMQDAWFTRVEVPNG